MSCCTLLAIQGVETSDTEIDPKLDYSSAPDQPELTKSDCCFGELLSVGQSALLAWQREFDEGKHPWAMDDSKRVAFNALSHAEHVTISSMRNLKISKEEKGREVYLYQPSSSRLSYMVAVSRPYWLSYMRTTQTGLRGQPLRLMSHTEHIAVYTLTPESGLRLKHAVTENKPQWRPFGSGTSTRLAGRNFLAFMMKASF